jgi:hypothetical protein
MKTMVILPEATINREVRWDTANLSVRMEAVCLITRQWNGDAKGESLVGGECLSPVCSLDFEIISSSFLGS